MTTTQINKVSPGKVVIVDVYADLPDVGVTSTLYIVRYDDDSKEDVKFYEWVNKQYRLFDIATLDEEGLSEIYSHLEGLDAEVEELKEKDGELSDRIDVNEKLFESLRDALSAHETSVVSAEEVHGLRVSDEDQLQFLGTDGEWHTVQGEAEGGAEVDLEEVKILIKEAVREHEDKTTFRDHVHGLRIDGGILEYWDHNKDEWVELFSSEFQSFPRVQNLVVVASETGKELLGSWDNPTSSPTYSKTEIYISETDITSMELEDVKKNSQKIIDSNTENSFTFSANLGIMYYVVAYAVHKVEDETHYSNARTASVLAADVTPPGDVESLQVTPLDQALSVSWENPTDIDFAKVRGIYKKGSAPVSESDGNVFVDGADESAIIKNLENGQEYWVRLYTYDLNGNVNESSEMIAKGIPNDAPPTGPGPQNLIVGDLDRGFYGEVSANELWTGEEFARLLGITQGTLQFSDTPWLKFAYKGKTLFRPKKAFRSHISWDHINSKGAVYGGKVVEHEAGYRFDVRLMKSVIEGKETAEGSYSNVKNSEWNHLMLPIHIQAKDASWAYPSYVEDDVPYWGIDYTDKDLHTHRDYGNGTYVWCQEHWNAGSASRVNRGYRGVSDANHGTSSTTNNYRGWAPVLELL